MSILKLFTFVPEKTMYIIERSGRYKKSLNAGISMILPFFDKIKYKKILKDDIMSIKDIKVSTKDNYSLSIDSALFYRLTDPVKSIYEVNNSRESIQSLCVDVFSKHIKQMNLNEISENRNDIIKNVVNDLNENIEKWGYNCFHYDIMKINNLTMDELTKNNQSELIKKQKSLKRDLFLTRKLNRLKLEAKIKKLLLAEQSNLYKTRFEKQQEAISILSKSLENSSLSNELLQYLILDLHTEAASKAITADGLIEDLDEENRRNEEEEAMQAKGRASQEGDDTKVEDYIKLIKEIEFYDEPSHEMKEDEVEKAAEGKNETQEEKNETKEGKNETKEEKNKEKVNTQ